MSRILVVEDGPTLLETVSYNLRREQHEVLATSNGLDGLMLPKLPGLPGLPGLGVCRALCAESPVLILVLTARETEVDRAAPSAWKWAPMTT